MNFIKSLVFGILMAFLITVSLLAGLGVILGLVGLIGSIAKTYGVALAAIVFLICFGIGIGIIHYVEEYK